MFHGRSLLGAGRAGASLPLVGAAASARQEPEAEPGTAFKLKYAPHEGMFKNLGGDDYVAQLEFMAAEGFRAVEDNQMTRRSVEEQERIAKAMERLGMQMGVFVCNWGTAWNDSFVSGKQEHIDNFVAELTSCVEVAKRVNATWMTVVLGKRRQNLRQGYQDAHAIEMLKRGAEVLEPHGLVMVMEPLNFRNHPGLYLERSDHAYMLCKAVDSPAVKILFDIYHQAISEGNIIPNIDLCWDEIGYFQIGDNPGRNEPTTGEVNYKKVFEHIHGRGFDGILGMEHGNSRGGAEGERAVIDAYRAVDVS